MLGIVILNYKTWETTIQCVNSILKEYKDEKRIYVVDNNSQNSSLEKLSDYFEGYNEVQVIGSEHNCGYAKGNNIGLNKCMEDKIEIVLITNNDVIFNKNSIGKMLDYIKEHNNTVIVGPCILDNSDNITSLPFIKKQNFIRYILQRGGKSVLDVESIDKAGKVFSVSGCCFMVKLNRFKRMGAFDENTFMYNEEVILGIQADKSKYDVIFLPESTVIHNHGTTTGKGNLFVDGEILKSGMYYWKKYENSSNIKIIILFLAVFFRTGIKILLGRTSGVGFKRYCTSITKSLYDVIKM